MGDTNGCRAPTGDERLGVARSVLTFLESRNLTVDEAADEGEARREGSLFNSIQRQP
ncbi:MAG: hypothetical protein GY946_01650 [bacterium]|nr:hypothetical protein [bacterium]